MKSRLWINLCIIIFVAATLLALWPQVKTIYSTIKNGDVDNSLATDENNPGNYAKGEEQPVNAATPLKKIEQFVVNLLTPSRKLTTSDIVVLTNQERVKAGLTALLENSKLDASAQAKVNDMIAKNYFDHVSPNGTTLVDLVKNQGYDYIIIGENLGVGTFKNSSQIVSSWMASSAHRENILNPKYTEIGAAVAQGTYQGRKVWFGVQHFGEPSTSCITIDQNMKKEIADLQEKISQLSNTVDAMKAAIDKANASGGAKEADINAYNAKVIEYNTLVNEEKAKVAQYNSQVKQYNDCLK